jgi:nicotinamide-nucleotide amidase
LIEDDKRSLEDCLGEILREKKLKIAVAESCTGGLISHRLTNIPGSSDYYDRGIITYSNSSKEQMLNVPKLILDSFGAVSQETAKAMAEGVRNLAHSDLGLSVTGIAGPSGGTPQKPVGLVYIGVASAGSNKVKEFRFNGSRAEIKEQTSNEALKMVLEVLNREKEP